MQVKWGNVQGGARAFLKVAIDKAKDGLKRESAVMIDQVRAIDNKRLAKKIGNLLRKSATIFLVPS
ncbi:MAG: type II toxin-antitoxin system PemK/MazF family toxin [Phaeodactylibacter sp.]|nr:type II toxin-antitoxin system PemK/MazF family toxin [Phaeodactylibacter sp.]